MSSKEAKVSVLPEGLEKIIGILTSYGFTPRRISTESCVNDWYEKRSFGRIHIIGGKPEPNLTKAYKVTYFYDGYSQAGEVKELLNKVREIK